MVIECSSCHARFKLADDKIKENGTKVRCTKCRVVFTVLPEKPPVVATPPVPAPPAKTVSPIDDTEKEIAGDLRSSETEHSPFPDEPPLDDKKHPPADEWGQEKASGFPSDAFSEDAGSFDLDAINFDNIEAPVFSASSKSTESFEFSDDTAFSFSDLSLDESENQPFKIKEEKLNDSAFGDVSHDAFDEFTADDSTVEPSSPSNIVLNQPTMGSTDELSFSEADDISGFSWEEPDASSNNSPPPIENRESKHVSDDSGFDFSSFSFNDDDDSSTLSAGASVPLESTQEPSISLAPESAPPALIETVVTPPERISTRQTHDRQSSTPSPPRPLRPRSRKKKTGSNRRLLKYLFLTLLMVSAFLGFKNREQIQQKYKIYVGSFIEKQTQTEISGSISLVKLSASYVLNTQEGELFVIRGEALNEFKGLRSSVLVKGVIYDEKGVILQSQSAYCGNPLPDTNLKKLGFSEIRNRMSNELGDNLSNLNIAPGKGIPCTIVFKNAPKNVNEFTVEVVESKPGSQ